MLDFYIFWLILFAVPIAYLYLRWSFTRRRQIPEARQISWEKLPWRGECFNASMIAPKLQQVREAHTALIHSHPHRA